MNARQILEQSGRAPVLGWCDKRPDSVRVSLTHTDIKETFKRVQAALEATKQQQAKEAA
jgi:hypothetical protein